jgi:hypothetical protein
VVQFREVFLTDQHVSQGRHTICLLHSGHSMVYLGGGEGKIPGAERTHCLDTL